MQTGLMTILRSLVFLSIAFGMHFANGTPYETIRSGDLPEIKKWLQSGADPNSVIVDRHGYSTYPLYSAVAMRNEPMVLYLLESGSTLADSDVSFPLVAQQGLTKPIVLLLQTRQYNDKGLCGAINSAAGRGFFDIVEIILDHQNEKLDAGLKCSYASGISLAVTWGFDDIARMLVGSGNVDYTNLLHLSARFRSVGLVRYLLANGADPNQIVVDTAPLRDQMQTPLDFSLWEHQYRGAEADDDKVGIIIGDLIKAGAIADRPEFERLSLDSHTYIPHTDSIEQQLVAASRIGFDDVVTRIISRHAKSLDKSILTAATITALENNNDYIARLLLSAGVNVNDGPLQKAVAESSPGMVRYILSIGGLPESEYEGKTATEWFLYSEKKIINAFAMLHELVVDGADVCWLREHLTSLDDFTRMVFETSAHHCFSEHIPED